ncbi:EF-hand domain-containing protein [Sphingomonas crusticola]|uniref:EF-hand domain-containing protein n=1 Tax=Sphingomonas crusticola TaxID=1697973 RepID=UPI000E23353D|nr:EF-hand domain-containing protein [Sphingomonas crusticola]
MTRSLLALSLAGLATAAVAQAPPASGTFDDFAARARGRMMMLDADHDGRISQAEFAARAEQMAGARHGGGADVDADAAPARRRDPSRMFTRLDANKDGYLDPSEIDAMIAKRFARRDANHDGTLTADERHAMRGTTAPQQ